MEKIGVRETRETEANQEEFEGRGNWSEIEGKIQPWTEQGTGTALLDTKI
jgi:hypothetical protein